MGDVTRSGSDVGVEEEEGVWGGSGEEDKEDIVETTRCVFGACTVGVGYGAGKDVTRDLVCVRLRLL